jgi:hypothetical protein
VEVGDGGRVIIWADDTTRFYGDISATGGALGGEGGFAEVSGKEKLDFDGWVTLAAVSGESGTLLLDPDILIVKTEGGDGDLVGSGTDDSDPNKYGFNEDDGGGGTTTAQITASAVTNILDNNTSVILQASVYRDRRQYNQCRHCYANP